MIKAARSQVDASPTIRAPSSLSCQGLGVSSRFVKQEQPVGTNIDPSRMASTPIPKLVGHSSPIANPYHRAPAASKAQESRARPLSWLPLTKDKLKRSYTNSRAALIPYGSSISSLAGSLISSPLLESTTNARVAEDEHIECSELVLPVNLVPRLVLEEHDLSMLTPSSSDMSKDVKSSRWSTTVRNLRSKVVQMNVHSDSAVRHRDGLHTRIVTDEPWSSENSRTGLVDSCRQKVRQWRCRVRQEDRKAGQKLAEKLQVTTPRPKSGERCPSGAYLHGANEVVLSSLTKSFASAIDKLD